METQGGWFNYCVSLHPCDVYEISDIYSSHIVFRKLILLWSWSPGNTVQSYNITQCVMSVHLVFCDWRSVWWSGGDGLILDSFYQGKEKLRRVGWGHYWCACMECYSWRRIRSYAIFALIHLSYFQPLLVILYIDGYLIGFMEMWSIQSSGLPTLAETISNLSGSANQTPTSLISLNFRMDAVNILKVIFIICHVG